MRVLGYCDTADMRYMMGSQRSSPNSNNTVYVCKKEAKTHTRKYKPNLPVGREDLVDNPLDQLRLAHLHILLAHLQSTLHPLHRLPPLLHLLLEHGLTRACQAGSCMQAKDFGLGVFKRMHARAELNVRRTEPRGDVVLLREEDALNRVQRRGCGVEGGDGVGTCCRERECRRGREQEDKVEDGVVL